MTKLLFLLALLPISAFATSEPMTQLDLTDHWVGYFALVLFVMAYILVMVEEFTHFRKSKPVILVAGVIWGLIGWVYASQGIDHSAEVALRHNLLEYAELFLFLLVAMTYIEAMKERLVFESLKAWLVSKGFTFRQLFWMTGFLAFFISPIADNLTTALIMGAVVLAVGSSNPRFVSIAMINIVVAANAGGAFSPFGDITTLMVWQGGYAEFFDFFQLFIPSVINYIIPAYFMWLAVPDEQPAASNEAAVVLKPGAIQVCVLFALTIVTAVSFKQVLHLPPFMGMMAGLGVLMVYGFRLKTLYSSGEGEEREEFDIFDKVRDAEWDTLFFFFGVVFAVGGLGYIGYLELIAAGMYDGLGQTPANILVGIISAIVDNIPVMFAVLSMNLDMDLYQWLLVTLTAGTGGSMLSVGSAAGVALMGSSNHKYTFFSHIKWTPVIALGYFASIFAHYLINS